MVFDVDKKQVRCIYIDQRSFPAGRRSAGCWLSIPHQRSCTYLSSNENEIQFWHHYLESTAIAFADRIAYIGDNRLEYEYLPITGLLSKKFAVERTGLIGDTAQDKPVDPGNPCPYDDSSDCSPAPSALASPGTSTTHLVTSDRWGNVFSYTLTIEATGGSGIVVPGRGFLLNNKLTDFDSGPNAPAPGKRPRRRIKSKSEVFRLF